MKTVYTISHGEYSDYRVEFVCEDRATAEAIVNEWNHAEPHDRADEYRVEELELIGPGDDWKALKKYVYYVIVQEMKDGSQKIANRQAYWTDISEASLGGYCQKASQFYFDTDIAYQAWAYSQRGYDVAEKSCYDLIAQEKAKDAGIA